MADGTVKRVVVPSANTPVEDVKDFVSDFKPLVFEDEDPFRHYRGKSAWERFKLFVYGIAPIFNWLGNYKLADLPGDIVGGLTITSLAVPQDLAYAGNLAKLPPVVGLHTSFVPPLIYAVFGSSRHIAIGPVAVVSLLLGSELSKVYSSSEKPNEYYDLALTSTFFAGIIQLGLGVLRIGFVIDFLSDAAIIGFMAGAAVTIGLQQTKGWFNYGTNCKLCKGKVKPKFTENTDIISVGKSLNTFNPDWSKETFVLGLVFLIYLFVARFIGKKWKKLFYINATAPLVSVVLATTYTYLVFCDKGKTFKYGKDAKTNKTIHGAGTCNPVRVVGYIKKGVNPGSVQHLKLTEYASKALRIGAIAGLVAVTELVAIGRTFAAFEGYRIDGNAELISSGLMNIAGSLTSCYIATGSFSRSAVNYNSGGRTQLTGIIMALIVLFTLIVLTPLFKHLPQAILSVIIIAAVSSLIEFHAAWRVFKTDKFDFLILLATFLGTIFVSVEIGLLIAISLSFLKVLLLFTRPKVSSLGRIPGSDVYRSVAQYPEAVTPSGVLVLRVDGAFYFANANYIKETILNKLEIATANGEKIEYINLDFTPVTDIDVTAINTLTELHKTLKATGIQLTISNPSTAVLKKLGAGGFLEAFGSNEWLFLSTADAVKVTSALVGHNVKSVAV
eukprot:TRINITY_DN4844_c0_g2_i1.p1 TRINITY_DN4844_c0_g2~~TRINITY_DN4844_c0_g2_i1.p1  ORF type:complete len:671 (+),score=150.34 TRINITY_DN4844_c0_g2_i1:423-2435(+)